MRRDVTIEIIGGHNRLSTDETQIQEPYSIIDGSLFLHSPSAMYISRSRFLKGDSHQYSATTSAQRTERVRCGSLEEFSEKN